MDAPATISNTLRAAIVACGLSYLELERGTGVHRASISRFVRGDRSLHLDAADKLAARLKLTLTAQPPKAE